MLKNQGLKGYKEMSILSAKPEQLILMLYDGALRFLRQAIKSLENNDIETAHHNFIRTQNILTELIASLNFDKGGEIALNLFGTSYLRTDKNTSRQLGVRLEKSAEKNRPSEWRKEEYRTPGSRRRQE